VKLDKESNPCQEFEGSVVGNYWEASAQHHAFFFYGIFMETKIYKFCTLCGPIESLEDVPEDANWEIVICRQCSYQEAHGMDHIED